MRIGQGFDVHAFSDDPSRALIIGGVVIPEATGLIGHSDADVATHALIDAVLGAAGLGDIGRHFPDTDPEHRGANSLVMLAVVIELAAGQGLRISSGDITVIAQVPRLSPYLDRMAQVLTDAVGAPISVKATTTEHLGSIGRSEGIAAMSVVLLEAL
jgi:2-C-methyl-D-erythritol 2,4-cyclodiphosphate synthase